MPNYIENYIAINGDDEKIAELRQRCFIREEVDPESEFKPAPNMYKFDVDALFPMPPELRETGAPTRVFDTQEEVDEANEAYQALPMIGKSAYIAITRAEAARRTMKYGKTLEQQMGYGDSEFGVLNGHDWSAANRASRWRYLHTQVLSEEPGLLVFFIESAWYPPREIYDYLVEMGFKVSWVWQGEEYDQYGMLGDYRDHWYRKSVWTFKPWSEWITTEERETREEERRKLMEETKDERARRKEMQIRRTWANWFRDRPEDWDSWFPGYDMETWLEKVREEGDDTPTK